MPNLFDNFTQQYSLTKTLRFELKPEGKTLENMQNAFKFDKDLQTFLVDQDIEDAYQTLKPYIDFIHEEFITESLESDIAKGIDFSEYFENFKIKKDINQKDFQNLEHKLRKEFDQLYIQIANKWKEEKYKQYKWKKGSKVANGSEILSSEDILKLVVDLNQDNNQLKDIVQNTFKGFFTYFSGFNDNRRNYYQVEKEAKSSIATRIVNENLPKFCDNFLLFENRKNEYLGVYNTLKLLGKDLVDKDRKTLVTIEEIIFSIKHFNFCLSQKEIENYNKQIGNANLLINLYNQNTSNESDYKRLPLFKTLYKQIGCGKRDSLFFEITDYTKLEAEGKRILGKSAISVEEVLIQVKESGIKYFTEKLDSLLNYILEKETDNYQGLYWSNIAVNSISSKYLANWNNLKELFKGKKEVASYDKGREEEIKINEAVDLSILFSILNNTEDWKVKEVFFKENLNEESETKKIIETSKTPSQALLRIVIGDLKKNASNFLNLSDNIEQLLESKEKIKESMDYALSVTRMLKYFLVKESKTKGAPLDSKLVEDLNLLLLSDDAPWFMWYDGLRNYLTKKPHDDAKENKLKLNFENSTLAGGWDINKEPANYCVILTNSANDQYLAINAKRNNKIFCKELVDGKGKDKKLLKNPLYESDEQHWKKMEYKLLPGPNKMLPKCLLPKSNLRKFGASEEVLSIYENGSFKKNTPDFSTQDLHKLIDFYKSALLKYEDWKCFHFKFNDTRSYGDISQFYSDLEKQGYLLSFIDINKSVLNQLVDSGKIYLFQIRNQDSNISKKINHQDNLHTIYWRAVFEDVFNKPKLNGQAEVFYRKALPQEDLQLLKDKDNKEIIANYRFSKEKFLFHVPITLNFCLKNKKINDLANREILSNDNIYFLGIDRGEKHLAYYSLVDQKGNIVIDQNGKSIQGTLNIPFLDSNGNQRLVKATKRVMKDGKEDAQVVECKDYNELLEARASDRDYARKNWQTIGAIKDLKDGYISQVVRKIADLAVEYNAYIVLEDLNTGFKRGRQKIEKSVYQKLELALAKKLNFLVDKSAKIGEVGSVTNALQLTPPVNNYSDIENRKQFGVVLYTRANYTSQTDPVTGWRKTIYLKTGSEDIIKKQIFESFSNIYFDGQDYIFTYTDKNIDRKWELYSGKNGKSLDRYRGRKVNNKGWVIDKINIQEILDKIFINFEICYGEKNNIFEKLKAGVELEKYNEYTAWESLRFAIDIIQQIRNTGIESSDSDFLLSPIRVNNLHFDSRLASENQPNSGDANGAYNIARKGIIMANYIKQGVSPFVSDIDWDNFVTKN